MKYENLTLAKGRAAMRKAGRVALPFLLFWFWLLCAGAVAGELSPEDRICMGCHGDTSLGMRFADGKSRSVHVDPEKLKASVHAVFSCTDCHQSYSPDKHPENKFKNERQYLGKASEACRRCHSDRQLRAKGVHFSLLQNRQGVPVCTDCHGAHDVGRVAGGSAFADEAQYCMSCHSHRLTMKFKDGDSMTFSVNEKDIKDSVHGKLGCSDCHFGFSVEQHVQRVFKSRRDYSIAVVENCRRCHFDKYIKVLDSIHYTMLTQGNLKAPVCTDCHGAHSISGAEKQGIAIAKKCQRCHPGIYETYVKSVHGNALVNEDNRDVPVCIDCHNSHNILDPRTFDYREKVPEICGNCHARKEIMDKYGLSTAVVKTYLQDFHGITLKFYRKQRETGGKPASPEQIQARPIAVCTDCHGIHDITGTKGPGASVVKANLVKRCQKCHADATENFPDSWVSHYEPSLSKAPLVFIINLVYMIFIPFMIIGLVLQILLHIWRYAVNR